MAYSEAFKGSEREDTFEYSRAFKINKGNYSDCIYDLHIYTSLVKCRMLQKSTEEKFKVRIEFNYLSQNILKLNSTKKKICKF